MAFPTDYYVVKHANPKELGRIIELALRSQILVTWLQISGGVIVSKNDGGSTVSDDVSKYVTRMNQGSIE